MRLLTGKGDFSGGIKDLNAKLSKKSKGSKEFFLKFFDAFDDFDSFAF
jgi:hypothetical protein